MIPEFEPEAASLKTEDHPLSITETLSFGTAILSRFEKSAWWQGCSLRGFFCIKKMIRMVELHVIFFVLETIRTGAMRVIHIPVKTEETQRLRIKFVLYCSICTLNLKIKRANFCRKQTCQITNAQS